MLRLKRLLIPQEELAEEVASRLRPPEPGEIGRRNQPRWLQPITVVIIDTFTGRGHAPEGTPVQVCASTPRPSSAAIAITAC